MAARRYLSTCPTCARPQVEPCRRRLPLDRTDALPLLPRGVHSWWWQGDAGDASTPGGWLRVFGRALTSIADPVAAWPHPDAEDAEDAAQASRAQLDAAVARGDFAQARAALGALEQHQHRRAAMAALPTTLRLMRTGGGAEIRLSAVNATAYHASFELPPSLAPGAYRPVSPSDAPSPKGCPLPRHLSTTPFTQVPTWRISPTAFLRSRMTAGARCACSPRPPRPMPASCM